MTTGTNNMTDINEPTTIRVWENIQYLVLALIMLGQGVCAINIIWGQIAFLVCNLVSIARTFALGRPLADKVKDVMCLGLTLAIIAIKIFA